MKAYKATRDGRVLKAWGMGELIKALARNEVFYTGQYVRNELSRAERRGYPCLMGGWTIEHDLHAVLPSGPIVRRELRARPMPQRMYYAEAIIKDMTSHEVHGITEELRVPIMAMGLENLLAEFLRAVRGFHTLGGSREWAVPPCLDDSEIAQRAQGVRVQMSKNLKRFGPMSMEAKRALVEAETDDLHPITEDDREAVRSVLQHGDVLKTAVYFPSVAGVYNGPTTRIELDGREVQTVYHAQCLIEIVEYTPRPPKIHPPVVFRKLPGEE